MCAFQWRPSQLRRKPLRPEGLSYRSRTVASSSNTPKEHVDVPTFWSGGAPPLLRSNDGCDDGSTIRRASAGKHEQAIALQGASLPHGRTHFEMSARRQFSSALPCFFQKNRPRHCAIPPPVVIKLASHSRAIAQEPHGTQFQCRRADIYACPGNGSHHSEDISTGRG